MTASFSWRGIVGRLLTGALALAVAGCATPSPVESYPDITFSHRPPIRMNVGRVVVENRYQPPLAAPNVEHLAPAQPATVMARWASDRFVAAGSQGTMIMRIKTAQIVEEPLAVQSGVRGLLKDEQSKRFNLLLKASVESLDPSGRVTGLAEVEVTRSRTINKGASLRERDRVLFEITEQALQTFDEQIERQVRLHLVGVLL